MKSPKTATKKAPRSDGCGHFLVTGIVSAFFLVINGVLVASLYMWLSPLGPPILRHPRAASVIAIVGPLLLVLFEWWLIDWMVDVLSPRERAGKDRPTGPRARPRFRG
jgi:hypothetical protein